MLQKMKDIYKSETGLDAFVCTDPEGEFSAYVECYTSAYIKWLEKRAAQSIGVGAVNEANNRPCKNYSTCPRTKSCINGAWSCYE